MGLVFRGVESATGVPVAIKQVNPRFANNPEIRRRARQEARMEFDHPNLVQMLGFCELPQGKGDFFIVSRMVNGTNIAVDEVVRPRFISMSLQPIGTQAMMPSSC